MPTAVEDEVAASLVGGSVPTGGQSLRIMNGAVAAGDLQRRDA